GESGPQPGLNRVATDWSHCARTRSIASAHSAAPDGSFGLHQEVRIPTNVLICSDEPSEGPYGVRTPPPGSRRESHPPAPTDPHVSLSTHTARTIRLQDSAVRYLQCANSSGFRVWTPRSHTRALLALRASRLYFHRAQRIRWRSMRLPSGITALG